MFNSCSTPLTMPVAPISYGTGYGNGNNGFFGDGSWWAILILFALFGGWGGNGFGGGFGRGGFGGFGGFGEPCATQQDVRNAVDQQTLISKLDQQTYGLADSTYALNNAINTGFNGVQQTLCQGFNGVNTAILQSANNTERGFANLSSQLAMCCCDIERGIDGVNYNMAKNTCDLQNTIHNTTRDIIDNANANNRAILDFLTQDKIATLQAENQALKFKASQAEQNTFITANQQAQTAELIRRLGADCPVNAYVVQPPTPVTFPVNCCGQFNGWGYNNYNNSCGCGCN